MKTNKQNRKNNNYHYYVIFILIFILMLGGLILSKNNNTLKEEVRLSRNEISQLEGEKKGLIVEKSKLNEAIRSSTNDSEEIEIEKDYQNIAEEFVKLYSAYDVQTVKQKKENLLKIVKPEIADSIVPEDMISDSEVLINEPENASKLNSTDPSFKSEYDSSTIYKEYVSPERYKYFAIVNYSTTSEMGDSQNTAYMQFDIEINNEKMLVTNYKIFNLN